MPAYVAVQITVKDPETYKRRCAAVLDPDEGREQPEPDGKGRQRGRRGPPLTRRLHDGTDHEQHSGSERHCSRQVVVTVREALPDITPDDVDRPEQQRERERHTH